MDNTLDHLRVTIRYVTYTSLQLYVVQYIRLCYKIP